MSADLEDVIFVIAIILLVLNTSMFLMMAAQIVNGVTNDPAANCLIHEFPYIQWCKQQKFNDFMDKFNEWSLNITK